MKYVPPLGEAPNTPYIDGNPAAGIKGSIVPAASIEHDQREIVAVIEGAGLTPNEADLTQLTQAIAKFITDAIAAIPSVPNATTTKRGIVELATNTEASAGTDTVRAVTPAGLAAAIAALAIDLNDFVKKTGDTMTGNLTISKATPILWLEETDRPTTHNRVRFILADDHLRIQTVRDDGAAVSNDYIIRRDASGATLHQFLIGNAEKMRVDNSGIQVTADFPRVDLVEADSTSTFNKARLVQQGDIFRIETPGISSDYLIAKNASGATSHTWRLGNDVKMLINATGLRLSDSSATTDAEVVAQAEFYRGENDKRVGRIGFPSNTHEHMHIQNETAGGDIRFIFGSTIVGRFDADGGAVIGLPTGDSQGAGGLNAEALFVNGQPVLGSGAVAQVKYTQSTASTDVTTTILHDNSVPQNNEGEEIVAVSITPTNASSTLIIEWGVHGNLTGNKTYQTAAIFVGTAANAIAAVAREMDSGKAEEVLVGSHGLSAGGIAARTYKLRTGPSAGTLYVNQGEGGAELFGTAGPASWIKVTEILP